VLAPALQDHYDIGLVATGALLISVNAGVMLTMFPWGIWADRVGERPVAVIGVGGSAVALTVAAIGGSVWLLALALVVAGMFGCGSIAAGGRAVLRWFDADERGLALGIRQMASPLGGALAGVLLPLIVIAGGLRAAWVCLAALAVLATFVSWRWIDDATPETVAPGRVGAIARDRRLLRLSAAGALLVGCQLSLISFFVLYLHDARGIGVAKAAAAFAIVQGLGAIGRIAIGWWSDRLGYRVRPMRWNAAALACLLFASAALESRPDVLLVPVLGASLMLSMLPNGLSFTIAGEISGLSGAGAAFGLQSAIMFFAGVVGPLVTVLVVATFGWAPSFALMGSVVAVTWVILGPLATQEVAGWGRSAGPEAALR
jgi:sugar phosphate permease